MALEPIEIKTLTWRGASGLKRGHQVVGEVMTGTRKEFIKANQS